MNWQLAVKLELYAAKRNYPPVASVHEGYAIILEELDEFWEICKLKPANRGTEAMRRELIQVAAMAIRTLEDCT